MKIAIITAGRLPVPSTKGGAVETKIDYILAYNATHHLHNITTYSICPDKNHAFVGSTPENHYYHINNKSLLFRLGQRIFKFFNKRPYYDSYIEYFLYLCLRHIKHRNYDIIITTNRPGYTEKISQTTNTPIILQLNNDYLNPQIKDAYRIKELCAGIITCSHYINNLASSVSCDKEVPVITVHNGIDIARFVNAHPQKRSDLGIMNDDYVVVFSGRIIPEKGVLELIKAIKLISNVINIKLLIIGASFYGKDNHNSPYMNDLINESEPIKNRVIFTGYIDYNEIPAYLKVANIAVVPSIWDEPFGLTVLEAMAAGLPLISTKGGGIPEICKETAILIERNNIINNIADSILFLYNNPKEAELIGKISQERSWQFDKDIFSKTYLEAVEKIVLNNKCTKEKNPLIQ